MRYRISKHIQFSSLGEYTDIPADKIALEERVLITDSSRDRKFFINPTMEIFIKKFSSPKALDEVTEEIAAAINSSAREIRKLIVPFFNYLTYRHFIVPENYVEKERNTLSLLNPDTIFDQYKIEQVIDSNEDIDVYRAIDLCFEKSVVIKLLKQPKKNDVAELQREYNFLNALTTTGVTPRAFIFVESNAYAYFVQEFVDGLSLPQFIRRKKNATRKMVLAIAGDIINAFKKIHSANIIHGDIHPSNIMLTHELKIKVLDFGLAIHQELAKDELVNFGGAYFFMPPERIKKTNYKKFTRKPDFTSDIFQMGVVLYMLLYDVYPFNGITWEELATEIKEKTIRFPEKSCYRFTVPDWIKALIRRCVAKKPAARFANAQELYLAFSKNKTDHAGKIRPAVKI